MPRDVITGVGVVLIAGLALYYGYQKGRTGVLPEHQAGLPAPAAALPEPPPVHGGP